MLTIGDKIKFYRELSGITQDELAEKLNTTSQNIYKYEKGIITNIPLSCISEMAELFGISIAKLLDWPDPDYVFNIHALDIQPLKTFLGRNIKKRRIELGLSLMDVARHIKIVPDVIEHYEDGLFGNITFSFLKKLAAYLDTTPEKLLDFSVLENAVVLDEAEKEIISVYRSNPVQRNIVNSLLNINVVNNENRSYRKMTQDEIETKNISVKIASSVTNVDFNSKKSTD